MHNTQLFVDCPPKLEQQLSDSYSFAMAQSSNINASTGPRRSFFSRHHSDFSLTMHSSRTSLHDNSESRSRSAAYPAHTLAPPEPSLRQVRSISADPAVRTTVSNRNPEFSLQPPSGSRDNASAKKLKRRTWMPGSSPKSNAKTSAENAPQAWVGGQTGKPPYDLRPLLTGGRVPELWDDSGDTLIYLFPPAAGKGPSFKLQSYIYASSSKLSRLAHGGNPRIISADLRRKPVKRHGLGLNLPPTPPSSPPGRLTSDHSSSGSSRHTRGTDDSFDESPRQFHLYFPIALSGNSHLTIEDIDALVAARNLFAFLIGRLLVATEQRQSIFALFMNISQFLQAYDFTNIDGSTYGEVAAASFDCYVKELRIADVRSSSERTIETLVLGERMRSLMLYSEGFTHAVGKYDDIQSMAGFAEAISKYSLLHPTTRNRLERAHIDLADREKSIQTRLLDFEFPSVFAGVMSSRTVAERKHINFDAWKAAFVATRRHVLGYYKYKFGSWPPKARSKENDMATNGLNRLVLKSLYADFSDMYDFYVDRTALTTRSTGTMYPLAEDGENAELLDKPVQRIIRRVCDEYDRSYPPVQPPVPFDTPLLPYVIRDSKTDTKKLGDDEIARLLNTSSNPDTILATPSGQTTFLGHMRAFERHQTRGSTATGLVDFRAGMWIFMYAVLQALPMLVIDAPGVRFHQGVEYFLCQPPRNGVSWATGVGSDGSATGKNGMNWYGVSGGQGVVNLPSDLVEHSIEGVYRRSHCWIMATKWSESVEPHTQHESESERRDRAVRASFDKHLPPPPVLADGWNSGPRGRNSAPNLRPGSLSASPGMQTRNPCNSTPRRSWENVLNLGLNALPLPPGVAPASISRPSTPGKNNQSTHMDASAAASLSNSSDYTPPSRPPSRPGRSFGPPVSGSGSPRPPASLLESNKVPVRTFDDILSSIAQGKGESGKKGQAQKKNGGK